LSYFLKLLPISKVEFILSIFMENMRCKKCSKIISREEKYAITLFIIRDLPSSPYYEHLQCPEKFSIAE